jgi:hypothetical protein
VGAFAVARAVLLALLFRNEHALVRGLEKAEERKSMISRICIPSCQA